MSSKKWKASNECGRKYNSGGKKTYVWASKAPANSENVFFFCFFFVSSVSAPLPQKALHWLRMKNQRSTKITYQHDVIYFVHVLVGEFL